jgi:hypothetical protein
MTKPYTLKNSKNQISGLVLSTEKELIMMIYITKLEAGRAIYP